MIQSCKPVKFAQSMGTDCDFRQFKYVPQYLDSTRADKLLNLILEKTKWETEILRLYGKSIPAPRLTAWFSDPLVSYRYSGKERFGKPLTTELHQLRCALKGSLNSAFNFVLANLYRDGNDYVGWHADDESDLGNYPLIASISLGASRRFRVRHNTRGVIEFIDLTHGSLLIMYGNSQLNFKHCIAKTKKQVAKRINLTFRTITQKI